MKGEPLCTERDPIGGSVGSFSRGGPQLSREVSIITLRSLVKFWERLKGQPKSVFAIFSIG